MKRKIFAIIIAVAITALLMNITWIIYEEQFLKDKKDDNDQKEKTALTPEEVNLTLNISSRGLTNYSNKFSVDGAPEGSNYTWTLDGELIGYEKEVRYTFFDVGIFDLRVTVKWDTHSKSVSKELTIERTDSGGIQPLVFPWYYPLEIEPYREYILSIEPGLTEPIMWLNTTLTLSGSLVKIWIELMEDNKMETFEMVNYDVIPVGQMQYYNSLYFDQDFFKEREYRETYSFVVRLEFNDPDSAILREDISYDLTY